MFWDFLYHECDNAGIWHVDFDIAQIYIGRDMVINPETALRVFNEHEERIVVLDNGRKWFIRPFIPFQYGILTPINNMHRPIIATLTKLSLGASKPLLKELASPSEAPPLGAMDKDMDKDGVKGSMRGKRFTPPTLQAVVDFATTEGLPLDAKKFFNHYESKGWVVGRTGMKDWKAAARQAAASWANDNSNKATVIPEWMRSNKTV